MYLRRAIENYVRHTSYPRDSPPSARDPSPRTPPTRTAAAATPQRPERRNRAPDRLRRAWGARRGPLRTESWAPDAPDRGKRGWRSAPAFHVPEPPPPAARRWRRAARLRPRAPCGRSIL